MLSIPNSKKRPLPAPVSVSGASGETSPHGTRESGFRTWSKKRRSGFRNESRSTFSFSLYRCAAHFFFSCKRKRNVGRNRSPFFQEGPPPHVWGAIVPPSAKREKSPISSFSAKALKLRPKEGTVRRLYAAVACPQRRPPRRRLPPAPRPGESRLGWPLF